jgi:hypothetical protein
VDKATASPRPRPRHSLNPCPRSSTTPPTSRRPSYDQTGLGISSLAATCLNLLATIARRLRPSLVKIGD